MSCLLHKAAKHAIIGTMRRLFTTLNQPRTTVERYLLAAG